MRQSGSRTAYSLSFLLTRQSAAIRRLPEFARLEAMLREAPSLARVRLSRTALRLLDEPRLQPRHLDAFRRTYRLPDSLFFRIFLEMKWSRRKALAARREEIQGRIEAIMETCPRYARGMLEYLSAAEAACSLGTALYARKLYPRSMKRAREMAGFTLAQWTACFRAFIPVLRGSYRTIVLPPEGCLMAAMLLECLPDPKTGKPRTKADIKASFRALSKECHPDSASGDDSASFRLLVKARDALLG
jgi:hypothetical protein